MKISHLLISLFVLILASCGEDETCREDREVYMQAGIFNLVNNAALSVDSITVFEPGNDSILYKNRKNINTLRLPLSTTTDMSMYICRFNQFTDTLYIYHTNTEYFLSFNCGTIMTHRIDTILTTNHYISKITVNQALVNNYHVQNIQIFR